MDLAADSPEITTRPPAYAADTVDSDVADGLVDATLLQNGTVQFDCKFTRPAVAAYLDWTTPEGTIQKDGVKALAPTTTRLELGPDGTTGTATLPVVASGKYRLRLVAERGIETAFPEHGVTVKPDLPPEVKKFAGRDDRALATLGAGAAGVLGASLGQGPLLAASDLLRGRSDEIKEVLPYDHVPLEFTATDDVAVALAEVEYRVNRGDPARDPIAATGYKNRVASVKDAFSLGGKVKPGDVVEYRIRVTDNLPPEFGGPHVVYYPADHSLVLHVASDKEILALRDDINARLEKIKEDLKAEERGVYKARSDSRDRPALTKDQANEVKDLKKDNTDTETSLKDLADAADLAPAFRPLADLARDVADKEMKESGKSLDKAAADHKIPAERDEQFQNSEKELDSAYAKLDRMKRLNEELAQKALAQENLAKLADKEKELADKAADLAEKDPVKDPSAKDQAEQLKQQQEKTAAELQKLTDENPALKKALDEARAEEARDLADRAKELAKQQRDLAQGRGRRREEAEHGAAGRPGPQAAGTGRQGGRAGQEDEGAGPGGADQPAEA